MYGLVDKNKSTFLLSITYNIILFFSKGATSLSSLPASNAEDTPKYFWDSFDLNNPDASNIDNKNMNTELTANHPDNASFVSESSVGGDRSRLLLQTTSANIIGPGKLISFSSIMYFSLSFFSLLTTQYRLFFVRSTYFVTEIHLLILSDLQRFI